MADRVPITFLPQGGTVEVEAGSSVLLAAMEAGIALPAPCGGRGRCGRCAVVVADGELAPPDDHESAVLERSRGSLGSIRLACRAAVSGPVSVRPIGVAYASAHEFDVIESAPSACVVGALDLGTTSVTVRLIDAQSGARLAEATTPNRQVVWGLDVLSRITGALGGEADSLAQAARESVVEALHSAEDMARLGDRTLSRLVVAANPAMASLLVGADVTGLAAHPFAARLDAPDLEGLASAIGVGEVLLVPAIEAFVGGDLVAGLLAVGLAEEGTGELYVDVGTNAEVALALPGRLLVASAPAGPAFEGWGVECGGGASEGGIVRVSIVDADVALDSRDQPPLHLTGSGLLSAVAALRAVVQIGADGRIASGGPLSSREFERDGVRAIALGSDPRDRSVYITQLDVRALQSAKAAVAAAIRLVLQAAGGGAVVNTVIVSGALGSALNEYDLLALGIVPSSMAGRIVVHPDAALRGASAIALDVSLLDVAQECVRRAEHIDLAASSEFTALFMESLELVPFDV